MDDELSRAISGSKLRLRHHGPFFTVLVGHLNLVQVADDDEIQTAAVDGRNLYVNKPFWMTLTPGERDFVLVHEVLHIAFGHCYKTNGRNKTGWNYACDFAINLICKDAGFSVLKNALLDVQYIGMTADEIYELLPTCPFCSCPISGDVLPGNIGDKSADSAYWKGALAKAHAADKLYSTNAMNKLLEFHEEESVVDWRTVLWKIGNVISDFTTWDRRLIHSGTYCEDLEPVDEAPGLCAICLDTSGSTFSVLGKFIGEVKQIAEMMGQNFPIYFQDVDMIGPLPTEDIDKPRGGGGTSFCQFFEEVKTRGYKRVVYLTDLDGEYPDEIPEADVLWVVPPGVTRVPPFGRVIKIVN